MRRVRDSEDLELMSYEKRKEILKNLGQEELLKIFDNYKPSYKPIERKQSPLDQQISLGISRQEKDFIANEVRSIRRSAGSSGVTVSSLVRSRAVGDIDIEVWRERAELGLRELGSIRWDKSALRSRLLKLQRDFDEVEDINDEDGIVLRRHISQCESMIEELERPTIRRSSKMSGRVTFNEANVIRWRAGRLTLTVADYMRFMIFGYLPFSEQDRHLSVLARRRFYVAIMDIADNGWGSPPHVQECPNCARYANENKILKEKLERVSSFQEIKGGR